MINSNSKVQEQCNELFTHLVKQAMVLQKIEKTYIHAKQKLDIKHVARQSGMLSDNQVQIIFALLS